MQQAVRAGVRRGCSLGRALGAQQRRATSTSSMGVDAAGRIRIRGPTGDSPHIPPPTRAERAARAVVRLFLVSGFGLIGNEVIRGTSLMLMRSSDDSRAEAGVHLLRWVLLVSKRNRRILLEQAESMNALVYSLREQNRYVMRSAAAECVGILAVDAEARTTLIQLHAVQLLLHPDLVDTDAALLALSSLAVSSKARAIMLDHGLLLAMLQAAPPHGCSVEFADWFTLPRATLLSLLVREPEAARMMRAQMFDSSLWQYLAQGLGIEKNIDFGRELVADDLARWRAALAWLCGANPADLIIATGSQDDAGGGAGGDAGATAPPRPLIVSSYQVAVFPEAEDLIERSSDILVAVALQDPVLAWSAPTTWYRPRWRVPASAATAIALLHCAPAIQQNAVDLLSHLVRMDTRGAEGPGRLARALQEAGLVQAAILVTKHLSVGCRAMINLLGHVGTQPSMATPAQRVQIPLYLVRVVGLLADAAHFDPDDDTDRAVLFAASVALAVWVDANPGLADRDDVREALRAGFYSLDARIRQDGAPADDLLCWLKPLLRDAAVPSPLLVQAQAVAQAVRASQPREPSETLSLLLS